MARMFRRALALAAVVMMCALLTGCGRGANKDKGEAAAAPTGPVVAADCLEGAKAYRYHGKIEAALPASLGSGSFGGFEFSGAFVAPDRTFTKFSGFGQVVETIIIGDEAWARMGNGPWEKSPAGLGRFKFNPDSFCAEGLKDLGKPSTPPQKERVNGMATLRYEYEQQDLGSFAGVLGLGALGNELLPENARLTLWVTEKERWPVRVEMSAEKGGSARGFSFDIEMNITDINKGDIKVEAPN